MKVNKLILAAAMSVFSIFAYASGPSSDYQLSGIACTETSADHLHLTCTLSNSAGDQSELSASLINYDVKNSSGRIIATGYGNTVSLDPTKLEAGEEYSVVVYALVNGSVVSQTITRHADTK